MSSSSSKVPEITPFKTMRGHTNWVTGIVNLPSGRRIITCSADSSLRLWDLESGAQIGEDWRDENNAGMWSMALSPNDKTVASGSGVGIVRLWDVETRKVIGKWMAHSKVVWSLCWSVNGKRVASGSWDGTARVWDINSGETVLTINTDYTCVYAVMYSTDNEKIATCGYDENLVKIWDSKTGELITTLKHGVAVVSLAWTSDGKNLIFGSYHPISIFDTATWQLIAVLDHEPGQTHTNGVYAISLSPNNRFLASASWDKTARLWNLDTNLPIGPPLQHEDDVHSAALSADGKVLVTGCKNGSVYTWNIHAIIKEAGLEDLILPISHSSAAHGSHHRPSSWNPSALFSGFSSLFRHSYSKTDGATELQQRPRRTISSHGGPRVVEVPTVQDRKSLFVAPRPQQQCQSHDQGSSSQSRPAVASTSTTPAPGTSAPIPGTSAPTPGAATK